jgi:hypothetical protein
MDIGQLALDRRRRIGLGEHQVREPIDLRDHSGAMRLELARLPDAASGGDRLEPQQRIARRPLLEQLRRHVVGSRRLLVSAHAERLELDERRPFSASRPRGGVAHRANDGQQVVPVADDARDAVADAAIGQMRAGVLLGDGRRQPVLVVLDDEDDGELPHGREVQRLVKIALAGRAVAGERDGDARFTAQLKRQRQPVGHRQHRAEMADHAHEAMLERSEVKRPVASSGEAARLAEHLAQQLREIESAPGEHAQVAMHRQDDVARLERGDDADGDGLLADA